MKEIQIQLAVVDPVLANELCTIHPDLLTDDFHNHSDLLRSLPLYRPGNQAAGRIIICAALTDEEVEAGSDNARVLWKDIRNGCNITYWVTAAELLPNTAPANNAKTSTTRQNSNRTRKSG